MDYFEAVILSFSVITYEDRGVNATYDLETDAKICYFNQINSIKANPYGS